jgi:YegS/Rv2252/BmrU family lipid kinase
LSARIALVVNPASRLGAAAEASVVRAFAAAGVRPVVERTLVPSDGVRLGRELGMAHDVIFVLGGDGTVMEVATGLAEVGSDAAIAILPGGTGNQLGRALSVPMSPARAVSRLLAGSPRAIDAGILNGTRRVGIGVGLGLDAAMIAGARGRLKSILGPASYMVSAMSAAIRPARFAVRAEIDGRIIERECVVAMALNLGHMFNGLLEGAPGTSLVDGRLDLVLVDARHLGDFMTFSVGEAFMRRRKPDTRWTYASGHSISLETLDASVLAQVDGDLFDAQRFELTIAPAALRVVIPSGAKII